MRSLLILAIVFSCCFYFSNYIYAYISNPILKYLPHNTQIIATQVTAPFMVPLQLSFICAVLLCAPYLLSQLWMFIKPGLYKQERQKIIPVVILSCLLFYIGISFGLFIIAPFALKFFTNCAPDGVTVMLDIGNYLDFIITIALAAGIAFQIPILTNLLIKIGIFKKTQLRNKRRHVIVIALIAGMLLAPPDVLSQLLLAIPMWGLFEIGLIFS